MWHFGSKCQRIGALVKANRKWLKVALALEVRKLGPLSLVSKLGEFLIFDSFLDLTDFWLFDVFPIFNNFSYFPIDSLPPLITSISLVANTSLAASTYDDIVVFSIDVSGVAILLKP